MYGQDAYKFYVIAAKYFMEGRSPNIRVENVKDDPFTSSLDKSRDFECIESQNETNTTNLFRVQ